MVTRLGLIMQYRHHTRALPGACAQYLQQFGRGCSIHGVEGLIQQQEPGTLHEHAGEQHALELSAGEVSNGASGHGAHAHLI